MSATHIKTNTKVAIKLMRETFADDYDAKKRVSEIQVLRKLSALQNNVFTTKIYDIIVPEIDLTTNSPIAYIFMVMDIEETDLAEVLNEF